ncbi:MAG: Acyl-CoA:1-acyl-sn-glycerol-3-phosphate acyltransferase, partial [uncultured Nocardioides sp.]
ARPHLPADRAGGQDRVPGARAALPDDRHRARPARRRRAAGLQPHQLRRLRVRRAGRRPVRTAGAVHGEAGDLRPPDRRPGDAVAAPRRGRPRRRHRVVQARGGAAEGRRDRRDLPRGHHLARPGAQGAQDRSGADRRGRGGAAGAGGPVGHAADVDQGPSARLLARHHDRHHRRRADRGRPGERSGRDAAPARHHDTDARRDDRALSASRAAARRLVAARPARRLGAHPRGGGPPRCRGEARAGPQARWAPAAPHL